MTNRRGPDWEARLVRHLRDHGFNAERLVRAGAEDEGDILSNHRGREPWIIEAKAERKMDFSSYVREAEVEAGNYAKHRGHKFIPYHVAIVKRPNLGAGRAYVVCELDEWIRQVKGE